MKTLKKSAPTLKRSQNGRFTPILYMFSLCHFQVQSEWMRLWDPCGSLVMTMEGAVMTRTKAMMKKKKKEEEGLVLVERR